MKGDRHLLVNFMIEERALIKMSLYRPLTKRERKVVGKLVIRAVDLLSKHKCPL
jgi:hypothetical protein